MKFIESELQGQYPIRIIIYGVTARGSSLVARRSPHPRSLSQLPPTRPTSYPLPAPSHILPSRCCIYPNLSLPVCGGLMWSFRTRAPPPHLAHTKNPNYKKCQPAFAKSRSKNCRNSAARDSILGLGQALRWLVTTIVRLSEIGTGHERNSDSWAAERGTRDSVRPPSTAQESEISFVAVVPVPISDNRIHDRIKVLR